MRVVIIGGGFGGIAAAEKLYNKLPFESGVEIILIDKNQYTTMIPSLPDISGNRIKYKYAAEYFRKVLPRGIKFLNYEVKEVDLTNKTIYMDEKKLNYDYLIFSPGSRAAIDEDKLKVSYTMNSLQDALKIRDAFYRKTNKNEVTNVVIAGAGYTGVELACNLLNFANESNKKVAVTLVEKSERILPMLNEEISKDVLSKLNQLGINVIIKDEVIDNDGEKVTLKSNKLIDNAFLCWCSGEKISLSPKGKYKTIEDGRIIVDEFLRIPEHPEVFVVGDAAAVKSAEVYLSRALNYAYLEGKSAGRNVASLITGEKLTSFKPKGNGWIIPLYLTSVTENKGGTNKGKLGLFLHYLKCGLKNYNGRNTRKYIGYGLSFPFAKLERK